MMMDVPDFVVVMVELLFVFPIVMVLFFAKFPDALPIFWTIVKRRNFVASLASDNVLSIRPSKIESDLWKVYSGIGKKALVTHEFESDPQDTVYLFGRPCILVRENNTRAIDPKVNELIRYMKTEMGLKTKADFVSAIKKCDYLIDLMSKISSEGGYHNDKNEFIAITFEDFWDKHLDEETKKFLTKFKEIKDGGLVINGLNVIRIHDVEDYIDRHNPETYAANELYIKRKAEISGSSDLKKLLFIILALVGMTLMAVLYLNGGAGAAAAPGMTTTFIGG